MLAAGYFGDLGGLSADRSLVLLDLRGSGKSAVPVEPATYRCDHQVDDVDALRAELGLDRVDLLGHSAGGALAVLYAARHPNRIRRLVLVTPSPKPVGLQITDSDRRLVAELRRDETWFPAAFGAFQRIWADEATAADWTAIAPFMSGRWDAGAQAWHAQEASQQDADAAAAYYATDALTPHATRSAPADVTAPVLLVAGEYDVALPPRCATNYAGMFPDGRTVVLRGCGHHPWRDHPARFRQVISHFLARPE